MVKDLPAIVTNLAILQSHGLIHWVRLWDGDPTVASVFVRAGVDMWELRVGKSLRTMHYSVSDRGIRQAYVMPELSFHSEPEAVKRLKELAAAAKLVKAEWPDVPLLDLGLATDGINLGYLRSGLERFVKFPIPGVSIFEGDFEW